MVVCACATGVVDACLIPEVPFRMDKLCQLVARAFERKGHAVVCVAEGAGQVSAEPGKATVHRDTRVRLQLQGTPGCGRERWMLGCAASLLGLSSHC